MTLDPRQRGRLLGGLLAAALAAAAWVGDPAQRTVPELAVTSQPQWRLPSKSSSRVTSTIAISQVNLEKLEERGIGSALSDPFALPRPRVANRKPASAPKTVTAEQLFSVPPLPFSYMGRLLSDEGTAVFLTQGARSLVVREGETIDSNYRVDRITRDAITLTYLPANRRQTILFGEPQ